MDELEWVPAWKLRQLIAARDLSPVELMESLLTRIDRLGPDLNPFITVAADQAVDPYSPATRLSRRTRPGARAVAEGTQFVPSERSRGGITQAS